MKILLDMPPTAAHDEIVEGLAHALGPEHDAPWHASWWVLTDRWEAEEIARFAPCEHSPPRSSPESAEGDSGSAEGDSEDDWIAF